MSETKTFHTSLAVIADIHGNRWALEAVLQELLAIKSALTPVEKK